MAEIPSADEATTPPVPGEGEPSPVPEAHKRRPIGELYQCSRLDEQRKRHPIELARLPGWPSSQLTGAGHGWGEELDKAVGGGLMPGELIAVGAQAAGSGKTAFVAQVAWGCALATAKMLTGEHGPWSKNPLMPVIIFSEMSPQELVWRQLGRWVGAAGTEFRKGASSDNKSAWDDALKAWRTGPLAEAARWLEVFGDEQLSPGGVPLDAHNRIIHLREAIGRTRRELEDEAKAAGVTRPIVPLLVVDPIQRLAPSSENEIEALNMTSRALRSLAQEDGEELVVIVTSDTNKRSATGEDTSGAGSFRGSYQLIHEASAAFVLSPNMVEGEDEKKTERERCSTFDDPKGKSGRVINVHLVKSRWGDAGAKVSLVWDPAHGHRWYPKGLHEGPPSNSAHRPYQDEDDDAPPR